MIVYVILLLSFRGGVQASSFDLLDKTKYLTLEEQYDFLNKLDKKANSEYFDLKVLGNTHIEGKDYENDIYLVTIGDRSKPVIFFDCGIHAREWISPATCLYLIERLTSFFEFEQKQFPKSPLKLFQWQFIPLLNPDGYSLTFTKDRFQRKNGRPFNPEHFTDKEISICRCDKNPDDCSGVDLNRNFPAGWGLGTERFVKESGLPCFEVYRGVEPLSEPETQILDKHVRSLGSQVIGAFSVHSYGQELYHPKGWLDENEAGQIQGESLALLRKFAKEMSKEIKFGIGSVSELLGDSYLEGGATDDYYFTTLHINITYTIELDPHLEKEEIGFELPPENILPVGKRIWKTLVRMAYIFKSLYPSN